MTIPLTGAQGLFTRVGHSAGIVNQVNTARGTTYPGYAATLYGDFTSTNLANAAVIYPDLASMQGAMASWPTSLQSLAQSLLITMAQDDSPQQPISDLAKAGQILIQQMEAAGESIYSPTLAATVAYTKPNGGSNTGNGLVVTSTVDPRDGKTLDMMFTETIRGTCTADAYTGGGGATAGAEPFSVLGEPAANSSLDATWPDGSGASLTANSTPAASTSSSVTDGSFQTWTGSPAALSSWTLRTGVWGTAILRGL